MAVIRTTICILLVLACSTVFAQDYEIRLHRPQKAGDRYELTASGSMTEQMVLSGKQQVIRENRSSLSCELSGVVTVLETDAMMRDKTIRLVVSRCVLSGDGKSYENEVLAKGTEVIARLDKKRETFLIDDKPASPEVEKVLGLFFFPHTSEVTDDDVFGTRERKKVGDSWPVNSSVAARDLEDEGMRVKAENVKGSTTLEKVVDVDGIKCLHLSGNMELTGMDFPLPPGFTVEFSDMSAVLSGDFPVDTSIAPLSETGTMTMAFVGKGKPSPDSPEVTLSIEKSKSTEIRLRFLKKS